jgi:DNA-binding transcriptional regulator YdaS (Cro superfamily)
MDSIDLLSGYLAKREQREPGQQSRLAKHLGVSPALVWQWLNRRRAIAPAHIRPIAIYTGFEVTPHQLDPVIYPNPTDGLPEERQRRIASAPSDNLDALLGELGSVLRDVERQRLAIAFDQGPAAMIREIEALELATDVRAQLLAAAQAQVPA